MIAEIHKPEAERRLPVREALAVKLAETLATDHRKAGPAFVEELRTAFSDEEIAELGLMVHMYIGLGRLLHLAGGDKLACEIYVPDI